MPSDKTALTEPPKRSQVTLGKGKKETGYATVNLPRTEYEKLVKLKEDLASREDYSWIAGLGLGAFIGFIVGLAATAAKRSIVICGRCGSQIDVTELTRESFKCPTCGQEFVREPQAQI